MEDLKIKVLEVRLEQDKLHLKLNFILILCYLTFLILGAMLLIFQAGAVI